MLQPVHQSARQYVLGFTNNYLLRGVIQALTQSGFIPTSVSAPPMPAKDMVTGAGGRATLMLFTPVSRGASAFSTPPALVCTKHCV